MSHQHPYHPQKYHTQQRQKPSQQPDSAKVHADLFGDTWIDVKSSGQVYRVPVPPELLTQVIADLLALLSPEQLEALDVLRGQRNG